MNKRIILTRYSFYKGCVIVCTLIMLGYSLLLPAELMGGYTYRFIISILGVLLAFSTIGIKNHEFCFRIKPINRMILIYTLCMLISALYTFFLYHYSLYEISIAVMPYLFIFFVYPITYLFCIDKGPQKILKTIFILTLVILLIKTVSWYFYTFHSVTVFPKILFEYGDSWVRNGRQRINAGYLVGISLSFCTAKAMSGKNRLFYRILTVLHILFFLFITAFRFQFITATLTVLVCMYTYGKNRRSVFINRLMLVIIVILTLFSPFVLDLIDSFRVSNSVLGSSTSIRLLTIEHFIKELKNHTFLLGLGLLVPENTAAEIILRKSEWRLFYLEDIGILGGMIKLGIMSLGVYGPLFFKAIKEFFSGDFQTEFERTFMTGVIFYMIVSCLLFNIFDLQRAYDVPYYLSLICYYSQKRNDI